MKKDIKGKITIIIIVIIIFILSIIFGNFQNKDKNQRTDDFEDLDQLEFTIDLIKSPYDIKNKRPYDITNRNIYYQFKNINDKTFTISGPEIGKSLDFIIKAKNGTEYNYAGPITFGLPWWKTLSPDEIENGTQMFGIKMDNSSYLENNYSHWQNSSTGEYWFFQPGTYKIYGKFESKPNNDIENILVGIWYSNVVILTIE